MRKGDLGWSNQMHQGLATLRRLAVNFVDGEKQREYLGSIPGDQVPPEILSRLIDAGSIAFKGYLPEKYLRGTNGKALAYNYAHREGPVLVPGLAVYEIISESADLTACDSRDGNISSEPLL